MPAAPVEVRFAPGLRPVLKHGSHNQKDHAGKGSARTDAEIANLALERSRIGRTVDKSVLGEDGYGYVSRSTGERFDTHLANPTGVARLVKEQGWDAPAQQVDAETFERLAGRSDLVPVYRGGPVGLERGMIEGTPFIGDGKVGPGTYVSTDRARASQFADGARVAMLIPRRMIDEAPTGDIGIANDPITDHGLRGVGAVRGPSWRSDYVVWNTGALIVGPNELA
jgi:hypothetical protein